jgi:hypothetical protein
MNVACGYAASRISSNLNGGTSKFGWLQALDLLARLRFRVPHSLRIP